MKTYDSFESWLKDQTPEHKKIIRKLRGVVGKVAPNLIEHSKWANGVWLKRDLPIIYIHTEPDHVQLGFFAGASLTDPKNLLRGNGKHVRHIRLDGIEDVDETAFATLIRKAVRAPSYK